SAWDEYTAGIDSIVATCDSYWNNAWDAYEAKEMEARNAHDTAIALAQQDFDAAMANATSTWEAAEGAAWNGYLGVVASGSDLSAAEAEAWDRFLGAEQGAWEQYVSDEADAWQEFGDDSDGASAVFASDE